MQHPPINLGSDNVTGCCPELRAALDAAADGPAAAYGADPWTERAQDALRETFEAPDLRVLLVATGTAANALALGLVTPPWGGVICHADSHVNTDECGAPEMFTGGAKLLEIGGAQGKVGPDAVRAAAVRSASRGVHRVAAAALSISQSTEVGTLYTPAETAALAAICAEAGLALHMDGARFANAVASLGCTPAEATWRAGVDILSLGATKNGAWACEAVVIFHPDRLPAFGDLERRRKRAAHLLSKGRFLGAQMAAWLADGLWLRNAAHANAMATRLADGLTAAGHAPLLPVQANAVFVALPPQNRDRLAAGGVVVIPWPDLGPDVVRMVTAFDTPLAAIDRVLSLVG